MKPILSIVIANYNYGRFLEDAIRSVVTQDGFEDCELIVVDGGSTDDSVEIIKRFADRIAWWVSEKDKGQSDAFNKGFAHARGKYLSWLNADDIIPEGSLVKIVNALKKHPDCDWFTGNMYRFLEDNRVVEVGWGPHWYPKWLQFKSSPVVVFGPTSFFSKKLYEEVGRINEALHYVMDTDLWVKFMMLGVKQRRINCFCWGFRMHPDSKTAEYMDHKVSKDVYARMCSEERDCYRQNGYRMSAFFLWVFRAWRILDGSAIRGWMLRRSMCQKNG